MSAEARALEVSAKAARLKTGQIEGDDMAPPKQAPHWTQYVGFVMLLIVVVGGYVANERRLTVLETKAESANRIEDRMLEVLKMQAQATIEQAQTVKALIEDRDSRPQPARGGPRLRNQSDTDTLAAREPPTLARNWSEFFSDGKVNDSRKIARP